MVAKEEGGMKRDPHVSMGDWNNSNVINQPRVHRRSGKIREAND